MTVAVSVFMPDTTVEQYDALRAEVGWLETPPVGGILHVVWSEPDGLHGLDVWESEADFAAFGQERIGPALAKLGLEAQMVPAFHAAHEVFAPQAVTRLD